MMIWQNLEMQKRFGVKQFDTIKRKGEQIWMTRSMKLEAKVL